MRGRDGWLFLHEGTNRSISQMTGATKVAPRVQMRWRRALEVRREIYGGRTLTVICPEKACVYPDLIPQAYAIWPNRFSQVLDRERDDVVYPFADADRATARRLYPRTDTHFTQYGAHLLAQEICRRLDIDFDPLEVAWGPRRELGDLGSAADPRESSENWVMQEPRPAMHIRPNGLRNRGRVARYEAGRGGGRHVLVFGDSFSGIALAEQLAHLVGTVTFVHSLSFDYELALRVGADYVIGETAERFLIEPPDEGRSLVALLLEKHVQGAYDATMLNTFQRTFDTFREVYGPGSELLTRMLPTTPRGALRDA